MLTGSSARSTTWRSLDDWFQRCSGREAPAVAAAKKAKTPAKKTPAKKTPAKKTPAKKTPAKKTSAKKTLAAETATKEVATQPGGIGSNPSRRYGPGASCTFSD